VGAVQGRRFHRSSLQVNFTIKEPYELVVAIIPELSLIITFLESRTGSGSGKYRHHQAQTPLTTLGLAEVFGTPGGRRQHSDRIWRGSRRSIVKHRILTW
jgi:hypothetical protein